jgi:4-hydroxymandelate oxidase
MPFTRRGALVATGAMAISGVVPSLKAIAQDSKPAEQPSSPAPHGEPVCLTDYEPLAKAKMSAMSWEYVNAGAGDEITVRWNKEAYQRIRLKPRVLVDATKLDTRVTLFKQEHAFPILLAPTSAQTLTHPEGELATARGASAAGAAMVLSSFSSTSLEDVAAVAKIPLWFQLYAQTDHVFTHDLVQRAEAGGYSALCLTVDTPISGARNRETRAGVQLPPMPNMKRFKGVDPGGLRTGSLEVFSSMLDAALTWKDVEWLCSFAKIPVLVKGVLNPDDADRAVKSGVAGIMVSNHGGRNLDTVPATIDALPQVVDRVAGRVPVLVDGGIRRGTDVLKALAFGANAVLIGRPYIYGLGAAGESGVTNVVKILQRELQMAMVLTGRTTIHSIDRSVIWS